MRSASSPALASVKATETKASKLTMARQGDLYDIDSSTQVPGDENDDPVNDDDDDGSGECQAVLVRRFRRYRFLPDSRHSSPRQGLRHVATGSAAGFVGGLV